MITLDIETLTEDQKRGLGFAAKDSDLDPEAFLQSQIDSLLAGYVVAEKDATYEQAKTNFRAMDPDQQAQALTLLGVDRSYANF